jgi:thiamine pyrophosphate-dependent acetolactate synthase large subunit-like protein
VKNQLHGGEAILQALRALDIDYVMTSPGSEWGALWEAFANQEVSGTPGPGYLSCGHETLAVDLAIGYTRHTGRMQAVVLHAGVGLLQGAMGIDAAYRMGVPMVVLSGEALTYGEREGFEPGHQWTGNLSVVGGPHRLIAPLTKWASQASSVETLYQMVVRAGEMAQRTPAGPVYLDVPIETMNQPWTPPKRQRTVPRAVMPQAPQSEIERVADLLLAAKTPVIVTEAAGRDGAGYRALGALAELLAIPVIECGAVEYSNFPKNHPLHQGWSFAPFTDIADLVLMVRSRVAWYPPSVAPRNATIVSIDELPLRTSMVYQNTQADIYLEGDAVHTLEKLTEIVRAAKVEPKVLAERRQRCADAHEKMQVGYRAARPAANGAVDPAVLCKTLGEMLPEGTIFIDETITHRGDTLKHLDHRGPQSYYRCNGGLGQGIGLALGTKLAAKDRLVVSVIGDGSFLYNPLAQALALSMHAKLPVLIVVFNNNGYEAMKKDHHRYYPDGVAAAHDLYYGLPITGFEYSALAKPFGAHGERVENAADLKPALTRAAAAVKEGRTAILNVMVSR